MKRSTLALAMTIALTLACAGEARARIFELQPHWWNAGRTCIESRNPPGLAWDDLPPRACVARETVVQRKQPREGNFAVAKAEIWRIAVDSAAEKTPVKL